MKESTSLLREFLFSPLFPPTMACCHFHLAWWVAVLSETGIFNSFFSYYVYPGASFSETTTTNIIKTEKQSKLRDLRRNLSKTARDGPHPPAIGASLREESRTILLTLGRNHSGENFYIFVTAAINLMHLVSLLSPNVPGNRRPLCEPPSCKVS